MYVIAALLFLAVAFYVSSNARRIRRAKQALQDAEKKATAAFAKLEQEILDAQQEAMKAYAAERAASAKSAKAGQDLIDAFQAERAAIAKAARDALALDDAARVELCEQLAFPSEKDASSDDQTGHSESHLPAL